MRRKWSPRKVQNILSRRTTNNKFNHYKVPAVEFMAGTLFWNVLINYAEFLYCSKTTTSYWDDRARGFILISYCYGGNFFPSRFQATPHDQSKELPAATYVGRVVNTQQIGNNSVSIDSSTVSECSPTATRSCTGTTAQCQAGLQYCLVRTESTTVRTISATGWQRRVGEQGLYCNHPWTARFHLGGCAVYRRDNPHGFVLETINCQLLSRIHSPFTSDQKSEIRSVREN